MTPFEFEEPTSLREAIALLDPDDASVRPFAGGTALMLMMKAGVFRPRRLVSLRKIEAEYSGVRVAGDGTIRIGALTPLAAIEHSPAVRRVQPVITATMRVLSNTRVRNVATLGGNLAHGDPHMDLPPVLIALDATVNVVGPAGTRNFPVAELVTGYYETQLAKNELIAEVVIPAPQARRSVYLKCTTRAAHDWPTLGVAVSVDAELDAMRSATVVVSAATERPVKILSASALLNGRQITAPLLREAGEAAAEAVDVTSDLRGSSSYKRQLVRVYVERALRQALGDKAGTLQ
jgi:carbon-monoxide dehydrogenase medium subunit